MKIFLREEGGERKIERQIERRRKTHNSAAVVAIACSSEITSACWGLNVPSLAWASLIRFGCIAVLFCSNVRPHWHWLISEGWLFTLHLILLSWQLWSLLLWYLGWWHSSLLRLWPAPALIYPRLVRPDPVKVCYFEKEYVHFFLYPSTTTLTV